MQLTEIVIGDVSYIAIHDSARIDVSISVRHMFVHRKEARMVSLGADDHGNFGLDMTLPRLVV
jgi:hypothetical protein